MQTLNITLKVRFIEGPSHTEHLACAGCQAGLGAQAVPQLCP